MELPPSFARDAAGRDYAARAARLEARASGPAGGRERGEQERTTMRVVIACPGTESNAFSSLPAGRAGGRVGGRPGTGA